MLSGHMFVGILFFKNAVYLPKFPGFFFFFPGPSLLQRKKKKTFFEKIV